MMMRLLVVVAVIFTAALAASAQPREFFFSEETFTSSKTVYTFGVDEDGEPPLPMRPPLPYLSLFTLLPTLAIVGRQGGP